MTKTDKGRNKAQQAKGAVQEKAGEVTGDRELRRKGKANQASSDLKQAGEKLKDTLKR